MSSKTKIVVLRMKEIIYTVIFAMFAILIIGLLCSMFLAKKNPPVSSQSYISGIYSSDVTLDQTTLTVEVAVTDSKIESIRISNLDDTINTMYPLLQPTIEDLAAQVCLSQSTENITVSNSNSYTAGLLLSGIEGALAKATGE